MRIVLSRRHFVTGATALAASLPQGGCNMLDSLSAPDNKVRGVLEKANNLTYRVQRLLLGDNWLAKEYSESDVRQPQKPNGTSAPDDETYSRLASSDFAKYKLEVKGLVEKPLSLSLDNIRAIPSHSQITRHDCVEGWSCIAKWTGAPLSKILEEAKPKPEAKYVLFRCFDTMDQGPSGDVKYYGSIDMIDAYHPQTILAYGLNGKSLPVANGAPLRVRIERQLGYKMNKYIRSIELVSGFGNIGGGKGGYWEDNGYDWYAGI
jgi:DMSO/TMAO reductase YedYZ molybdopterin-dependent catalytic subunit